MAQQRVSYRYLAYSAMSSLRKVFSDADITLEHCIFWVKCSVNRVVAKQLNTGYRSGSYLATFTQVPVVYNTAPNNNLLYKKKYLALPANVFDLDLDTAVDWIIFRNPSYKPDCGCQEHFTFQRSTLTQVKMMYETAFEKPGVLDNFYFVRVNNLLYLFGIEDYQVPAVDMAVRTSVSPYIKDMNLDDEVMLNDEQILEVINGVVSMGRYVMMIPKERVEDAADNAVPAQTKVVVQDPGQAQ